MGRSPIYENEVDPQVVKDDYHGCKLCYHYSCLFGNAHPAIRITCDEEFEEWKAKFVEHFNKKHRNLMNSKRRKVKTYKKVQDEPPKYNRPYSPARTRSPILNAMLTGMLSENPVTRAEIIQQFGISMFSTIHDEVGFNTIGARIPEYETTGEESNRRMRD